MQPHHVTALRMPARRTRRAAFAIRAFAAAMAAGVAAALAVASPAAAADPVTPTISTPAQRTGYGTITITGTARPGAEVLLYESAIGWNDMQPAVDYDNPGNRITVTADGSGAYQIVRYVDSGFMFAVEADGLRSETRRVLVQIAPAFWVQSPRPGTIVASVDVSPNQPELAVHIQRATADGSWTTVASGVTDAIGGYSHTLPNERPGTNQIYRAVVDADPANGILANTSVSHKIWVTGTTPPPPPAPSTPVGALQFTRIQYDSPGTDTGSNTSLNGEWFRVTNRTTKAVALKGWTVRDAAGNIYRFASGASLRAGGNLYVRTGKGTAGTPVDNSYWNRATYVWNNGGDTATVRDAAGKTIDSCRWTSDRDYTNC